MAHFDQFIARHGEVVTQAIIENLERAEGIRAEQVMGLSLEERWHTLMQGASQRRVA